MARTYKTIKGLTYRDLDLALSELGYKRQIQHDGVTYRYAAEKDALLLFPKQPLDSEVRGVDLVAARSIVDSFGIMDATSFDMLLMRHTHSGTPTPA